MVVVADQEKVDHRVQQVQAVCRARQTLKEFNRTVRKKVNKIPRRTVKATLKKMKDYGYQLRDC